MEILYTALLLGTLLFAFLNYYLSVVSSGFWKHFALFVALFNLVAACACLVKLVF
jgi:hypothetical protein